MSRCKNNKDSTNKSFIHSLCAGLMPEVYRTLSTVLTCRIHRTPPPSYPCPKTLKYRYACKTPQKFPETFQALFHDMETRPKMLRDILGTFHNHSCAFQAYSSMFQTCSHLELYITFHINS